ncbi:hypothetical protein A5640_06210 [Mycobacterium asiaticum]|uniref:Uncharacterized protein n=2 Tax=Mycobacterium asiaticum TaxID=1790 RepID=A0A1A3KTW6_MYCAS|nr:hypothetical protein A5640_06210 [Mycobacterium asiaticum]
MSRTGQTPRPAARHRAEALRRKKRQGSETRSMDARLQLRYDREKLQELEAAAGSDLNNLIRQCGDLLTELLPIAEQRGLDPVDLIRQTAYQVLEGSEQLTA